MRSGIIAGGNWIVDHLKIVTEWPAQDSLATIIGESYGNGGSPYNVLKDLSLLGATFPRAGVGLIGDDAHGRSILADCQTHQIDTRQIRSISSAPTSYTDVITVQSSGRRTFFHHRGANAHLSADHFNFESVSAKLFHLGYLLLLDRLDTLSAEGQTEAALILTRARAAGLRTSADCVSEQGDRFLKIASPSLPHIDYFFANDYEAEKLTGISLRENGRLRSSAIREAGRKLLDAGVKTWVILHFTEGAYAISREAECWQGSVRVPASSIKGAAGAGDAFAAGVLYGLHEEWPISECLRLGVCAAASSLYHPSCSGSVRSLQGCWDLANSLGMHAPPHEKI
ncbi:MAG TPA: carbohydrate kinase family protein [Opitutaceae bacterium]|nr:carbohydrate kinase family protein [Opitutaceae bacterium]